MDHLELVHRKIARHGWYVQGVLASHPAEVTFAYTVGNHGQGLPELIMFGVPARTAGCVLNDATRLMRSGRITVEPGVQIPGGQVGIDPAFPVRLGPVAPRRAREYALFAFEFYGHEEEIELLQVVVADPGGRFRGEPGYERLTDRCQPDLSDVSTPWHGPFVVPVDPEDSPDCDVYALVPIIEEGRHLGRTEAVPAVLVGETEAEVIRPPMAADWVTVGTVVEVGTEDVAVDEGLPPGRNFWRVLHESPDAHLSWQVRFSSSTQAEHVLTGIVRDLDMPGVTVFLTGWSVHVSAPPRLAETVRSRIRHLERDGLAVDLGLYHRDGGICLSDCLDHGSDDSGLLGGA